MLPLSGCDSQPTFTHRGPPIQPLFSVELALPEYSSLSPQVWLWHLSPVPWDERGSGCQEEGAGVESIQGLCIADMDGGVHQRGGACVQRPGNGDDSTDLGQQGTKAIRCEHLEDMVVWDCTSSMQEEEYWEPRPLLATWGVSERWKKKTRVVDITGAESWTSQGQRKHEGTGRPKY